MDAVAISNCKDQMISDLKSHVALRNDQFASLRDSLALGHFREMRLIAKIDEQRRAMKRLDEDNHQLRERIKRLEENENEKKKPTSPSTTAVDAKETVSVVASGGLQMKVQVGVQVHRKK